MIFKIFVLTSVFLVCQGLLPDDLVRRFSPRLWLNGQGLRQPEWNYQFVNGKPIVSGFPNRNSFVAFELNPQTGKIEQTEVFTQTRPGGAVVGLLQNMMNGVGKFVGQLTGALGDAVGGALESAGQFGTEIKDIANPLVAVAAVPKKEPVRQPPPPAPPVRTSSVPSAPAPSAPSIPVRPKANAKVVAEAIDQAIAAFRSLKTSVTANFEASFEGEQGEKALTEINENIDEVVENLQGLREKAATEPKAALQSGRDAANAALDDVEDTLVGVVGDPGKELIGPARDEVNVTFDAALQVSN